MYHHISGTLTEKSATSAVLETNGVGYWVQIPLSTFEKLPALGERIKLLIHFVVREDTQALFAFSTEEERRLFQLLISVSGIGPKLALTILSGISIQDLKQAIVQGSLEVLKGISGIGKKTAERMVIELREKLVLEGQESESPAGSAAKNQMEQALVEDSVEALVSLGYRKQNAKTAVEKAIQGSEQQVKTVEQLIRASLKFV